MKEGAEENKEIKQLISSRTTGRRRRKLLQLENPRAMSTWNISCPKFFPKFFSTIESTRTKTFPLDKSGQKLIVIHLYRGSNTFDTFLFLFSLFRNNDFYETT